MPPARKTAPRKATPAQVADYVPAEPEVPEALTFTTTADTEAAQAEEQPFTIDGETYTAVRPKDAAYAFLSQAAARTSNNGDKVVAVFTFLDMALTEESASRLRDRLMDRDDPFQFEDAADIMGRLVEHWQPANRAQRRANGRRGPAA
jgi:hypothetical protein